MRIHTHRNPNRRRALPDLRSRQRAIAPMAGLRLVHPPRRGLWALLFVTALGIASGSGCVSAGRLGEHDFRGRSLGVVPLGTPRPEILTNDELEVDLQDPVRTLFRVGADLVKEVEAARARPRLQAAAEDADVGSRMMERVLRGVAGELRAVPLEGSSAAEYELEVRVKRYGIDAEAWTRPAHFFVEAELVLREGATGRRIWKGKVTEREAITPALLATLEGDPTPVRAVNDVLTAAALSSLSQAEMSRMLQAVGDYAADRMLTRFRKGLEKSRG
jgi:hypothetical protein